MMREMVLRREVDRRRCGTRARAHALPRWTQAMGCRCCGRPATATQLSAPRCVQCCSPLWPAGLLWAEVQRRCLDQPAISDNSAAYLVVLLCGCGGQRSTYMCFAAQHITGIVGPRRRAPWTSWMWVQRNGSRRCPRTRGRCGPLQHSPTAQVYSRRCAACHLHLPRAVGQPLRTLLIVNCRFAVSMGLFICCCHRSIRITHLTAPGCQACLTPSGADHSKECL